MRISDWSSDVCSSDLVVQLICRTAYSGARSGAQIAIIVAVIGVLVDLLTVTGFAQKLSFAMLEIAGGSLPLLLIMAAVACLAFGLGLPTRSEGRRVGQECVGTGRFRLSTSH